MKFKDDVLEWSKNHFGNIFHMTLLVLAKRAGPPQLAKSRAGGVGRIRKADSTF